MDKYTIFHSFYPQGSSNFMTPTRIRLEIKDGFVYELSKSNLDYKHTIGRVRISLV